MFRFAFYKAENLQKVSEPAMLTDLYETGTTNRARQQRTNSFSGWNLDSSAVSS